MLIYETEGFLEAEIDDIKSLCRSKKAVSYGEEGRGAFDLLAILCEYQDNSDRRCRLAFYAKDLKKAQVFTVSGSDKKASWGEGQNVLAQLGFEMEDVNLKLSPAMLEVVLKDVPGFKTPAQARAQRAENKQRIAGLQKILDDDPESPQGKKAALKLNAEKRLNEKAECLRQLLEEEFSPEENVNEELDALVAQVKDLTARLEAADSRVEEERSQREMSETITAAAEKRIQELEEILVDVETKSSGELKLKRKIVALQGQLKTLETELQTAQGELVEERGKHEHFVGDVKAAQERVSSLEAQLKEEAASQDGLQLQLEEGLEEREQLENSLKEAELRIKVLGKDVEKAEKKSAQQEKVEKGVQELEDKLAEAQKDLSDALEVNQQLEAKLTDVDSKEYEKLLEEHQALKEAQEQENSIRRRLERGAAEDEKRIAELETALAEAEAVTTSPSSDGAVDDVARLNARIEELQKKQRELLKDLDSAHKMIDSLEQMIREREGGSGGWKTQPQREEGAEDKADALAERINQLELQLEHEQLEQKKLAKTLAATEKKLAGKEGEVSNLQTDNERLKAENSTREVSPQESRRAVVEGKKLPHELRPAPQKGALFHPDWDLAGLPCKSSEQVLRAWETVFNVQISLEGYPSQYCTAFLVLLREGKQKKVYLLYRLKLNKHTLVCVPKKQPKDEKALKKSIADALKFLKMSSFEMDELDSEHVEGSLGIYFSPAG